MRTLNRYLSETGRKLWAGKAGAYLTRGLALIMGYLLVYSAAVLLVRTFSLTWFGLLFAPILIVLGVVVLIAYQAWYFRDNRNVARYLEAAHPEIDLAIRGSLDFLENRVDTSQRDLQRSYVDQTRQKLEKLPVASVSNKPWPLLAAITTALTVVVWLSFGGKLLDKFYNPSLSFGQTRLDLSEGSITIFEPEYTQVPGRTLPLKPGTFQAYPGSRVRFNIQLPPNADTLYMATDLEPEPVPLNVEQGQRINHEFVLLEKTSISFFLSDDTRSGKTKPYDFHVKDDTPPGIELRSYTPEGPINIIDPLNLDAIVKDDFGIKALEAVVEWEGGEKRLNINVPRNQQKHFISRNHWNLSDLGLDEVTSFTIYLEAKDNNPVNGPGVTQSERLTYELESPKKKYNEFMDTARRLLDTMTHTLGDNLETTFGALGDRDMLDRAGAASQSIQSNLLTSMNLTLALLRMIRETPSMNQLDQNFLFNYRERLNQGVKSRTEMNYLFENVHANRGAQASYGSLQNLHGGEELKLEQLTYDLLLQLKMWALLELERQNAEMEEVMQQMESLLENSENMTSQELNEAIDKLIQSLMKQFAEMMEQAAKSMDMNMEEFLNSEAMQSQQQEMKDLFEQLREALKNGDMDKAKAIMEELRQMMQSSVNQMQETMGQMSPEMMAMMEQLREMFGLLKELKDREEGLEMETQTLRQELDKEMGNSPTGMEQGERQRLSKILDNIHRKLTSLHQRIVDFSTDDMTQRVLDQISNLKSELDRDDISNQDRARLQADVNKLDRTLDFLLNSSLDEIQSITLKSLEQTETMQDYLDQAELMLSLETGLKLNSFLSQGERRGDLRLSEMMQDEVPARETFQETREELLEILQALQSTKEDMERRRRDYMNQKGEQRQAEMSEKQAEIEKMIEDFLEKNKDTFGSNPIGQRLREIARSMRGAEGQLKDSRLDSAVRYEQDALRRIGEMLEQMMQAQQPMPGGGMLRMGQRRESMQGNPIGEVYIPESQRRAKQDEMKEAIRRQLRRNLPESYGKEIRKYYEKIMDQ